MKRFTLPLLFAVTLSVSSYGQDYKQLLNNFITQNKSREYQKADLLDFSIDIVEHSESMKGDILKFQQLYKGLPVFNSVGSAIVKDEKVIYFVDTFVKNYNSANPNVPAVSSKAALDAVANNLNNSAIKDFVILKYTDKDLDNNKFAKQSLLYFNQDNNLKLAYQLSLPDPLSSSYWNFIIDANNGTILSKQDLNLSCNFYKDAYSSDFSGQSAFVGPLNNVSRKNSQNFLLPDNASYNVFPFPVEAPTFGSRTVVSNPWILASSPEGWHSDGTNHYTYSRGNNVYAYEDTTNSNLVGATADGGATRNFNFPFSITGTPAANQNASITNLFYTSNVIHDVFYKFGFTEAARNFQQTNFTGLGAGNDYVNAEAQDGAATDNANFSTPADGSKPRMQMFLWTSYNKSFFTMLPMLPYQDGQSLE